MEGNRDEAERCIDIAVLALRQENFDKAEKFIQKAEKLFPTQKAKDVLERVRVMSAANKAKPSEDAAGGAKRRTQSPSAAKAETRPAEPDYTKEQVDMVTKIKKCKDFYEVLSVTKDSADSDIKKAYKKMALQLHPDKNKAPGASEAFKIVGNAVATLTDPEKRKMYDLYGKDEIGIGAGGSNMRSRHSHRNENFAYSQRFDSDYTAEELFNMFFGGGFPQQQNVFMRTARRPTYRMANENGHHGREQQSNYTALVNLLPIILLILLSMMSSFFISEPIYSLQPSLKYSILRKTNTYKVSYYVKENFHTEYQGSLGRLETSVEEEYINNLKHSCYREKSYKESMLSRARNFGDRDMHRKAQLITTPSCDNLQRMQNQ